MSIEGTPNDQPAPRSTSTNAPILRNKRYGEPSVFLPENLLREARRQNGIPSGPVPEIAVLDPDGDLLRHLIKTGDAAINPHWACYHTELYEFEYGGITFGIIGCAVGASFAVLLAEELFASGCRLLVSITSAGQILPSEDLPVFLLIERALRDEGTSYHYLPPGEFAAISRDVVDRLDGAFADLRVPVYRGSAWTTDAPFRETATAIEEARRRGIDAVEMESAGLYAFAEARGRPVICFAYITNQMATVAEDFEKGEDGGTRDMLELLAATARAWRSVSP